MRELDKLLESTDIDDLLEMDLDQFTEAELEYIFDKVQNKADDVCYQLGIDYNIRDVWLVDRMEDVLKLIERTMTIAYMGGVNYVDALGTTRIWDAIVYRFLHDQNIAVPPERGRTKTSFPGAYVKEPMVGMHNWITSFDLNSLYPNLIVQYNMSPETLVEGDIEYPNGVSHYMENPAQDGRYAVAANGVKFKKDSEGVLPSIVVDFYARRKSIKTEMISKQQEYESLLNEYNKLT